MSHHYHAREMNFNNASDVQMLTDLWAKLSVQEGVVLRGQTLNQHPQYNDQVSRWFILQQTDQQSPHRCFIGVMIVTPDDPANPPTKHILYDFGILPHDKDADPTYTWKTWTRFVFARLIEAAWPGASVNVEIEVERRFGVTLRQLSDCGIKLAEPSPPRYRDDDPNRIRLPNRYPKGDHGLNMGPRSNHVRVATFPSNTIRALLGNEATPREERGGEVAIVTKTPSQTNVIVAGFSAWYYNQCGDSPLYVGAEDNGNYVHRLIIDFNVAESGEPGITTATLKLTRSDTESPSMVAYRLSEAWVCGESNWNERESGVGWTSAGGTVTGSSVGGSWTSDQNTETVTFDVTSFARSAFAGDGILRLRIGVSSELTDGVELHLSGTNGPELDVQYS